MLKLLKYSSTNASNTRRHFFTKEERNTSRIYQNRRRERRTVHKYLEEMQECRNRRFQMSLNSMMTAKVAGLQQRLEKLLGEKAAISLVVAPE